METASDGEEGLSRARQLRPVLITLDVIMPGLDGWAVLAALKADPELADIPVIMLTMVDDRNKGFALGASDYLTKPLDRGRLAALLRQVPGPRPVLLGPGRRGRRADPPRAPRDAGEGGLGRGRGRRTGARPSTAVAARRPDLILLDLLMPEMDGFEFLEELRKEEANRSIPIVVITAKTITAEDRMRLNGSVERILLKKASSREELLRQVRELVATYAR